MKARRYTIEVVLVALRDHKYPSVEELINGINDGLPKAWFTLMEGDEYRIDRFEYDNYANKTNPEEITL